MSAPCRSGRARTASPIRAIGRSRPIAEVYDCCQREVEQANAALGRVEQVKAFRILDRELDPEVEGEAVTATRKIKRSLLQQQFAHLIDEMYGDDEERRIARQSCTEH